MEVTYGDNGFHPHLHVLLFISSDVRPSVVQTLFAPLWQNACVKRGLPRPSDAHGCKVDDGSKAAAYVSKGGWGLESEMTKGHTKTAGEGKGMTPWDMLRAVFHDKDEQAGKLFKVYFDCFKGRRQLCWSKGLQKMLSVVDLTDEEIAAQEQEQAEIFSFITVEQWRVIFSRRWASVLLDLTENKPESVEDFLKQLPKKGADDDKEEATTARSYAARTGGADDKSRYPKGEHDESRLLRQEESQNACGRDMGKQPSNGSCHFYQARNDVSIGGASDAKPDLVRVGGQGGAGRARGTDLFDLLAGRSYATRKGAG